ncbi:methyltransferase domain-containing protein [Tunturiibacter gelidoferens]|uniref:Methyltransferase domain-containing protein n=1 Tax=Tunturiibacter gelidiferens TaxID=3069689 RepID=A0AAU7Z4M1_9BACT
MEFLMGVSIFSRAANKARIVLQGRVSCFKLAVLLVKGKKGLEIGGPSAVFRDKYSPLPIYGELDSLDNCDIARSTTWGTHSDSYIFAPHKHAGKNIFCDGSDLSVVSNESYDFVLSSHNLEHFANPVKALKEWQRVTRPGGSLILVLPNYTLTFDHRRQPTPVSHMIEDFDRNTQEDDLTHLPEILRAHDLGMDLPAGTPEEFRARSLNNFSNRCLHHHVFDEANSQELLTQVGMEVLAVDLALPHHIFLLARRP